MNDADSDSDAGTDPRSTSARGATGLTRRQFLLGSAATVAVVAAVGSGGVELVAHGVLPGKQRLDAADGACSVASPVLPVGPIGTTTSGSFHSTYRNQQVGYTIGYPAGFAAHDRVALIVALHGYGGNHTDALVDLTPAQAAAPTAPADAKPTPFAVVTVDGGNGYWHAHPGDDPMGMVINELIPRCGALGLGTVGQIGVLGTSMGGYGALLFAAKRPDMFAAVAAISPAVWTSYDQAHAANAAAFTSATDFATNDLIRLASMLANTPTLVFSGTDDPFHSGVETLAKTLPASATVDFRHGCHTGEFFAAHQPASFAFLGASVTPRSE